MRLFLRTTLVGCAAAATAPPASCVDASTAQVFSHERAVLTVATDDPIPGDEKVTIRGRQRLPFSWHTLLPEFISSPVTVHFPLVAVASDRSEADTLTEGNASVAITDFALVTKEFLRNNLLGHGAVLLRGLPLNGSADYSDFVDALGWTAVKFAGGGTQRSDVMWNVRSASDEPPEQTIEPHMDMAHSMVHPKRIGFFCAAGPPPGTGGETILTDMRAVYKALEAKGLTQAFEARGGIAYHKRLWSAEHVNHTYTWQKFFFTEDLDAALREVRKRDVSARVHEHGPSVIEYKEVLPAVHPHPLTGEPTWFNGAHTNHRSYYDEALHVDTSDGSPMDTTFADGTPIPDSIIAEIRATYWHNSVAMQLKTGDLVIVDNLLASHGRMSWMPPAPRKILLTHFSGGFDG